MNPTEPMNLRPHHVLDIVVEFGHGIGFEPHPYGHAVHIVAATILTDADIAARFVIGADAICEPCCHLKAGGQCDDILTRFDPPRRKQDYNDALDRRLCDYLALEPGTVMTVREFLRMAARRVPGVETVYVGSSRGADWRLEGLRRGLEKLGIPCGHSPGHAPS